jgi:hypothetical protein
MKSPWDKIQEPGQQDDVTQDAQKDRSTRPQRAKKAEVKVKVKVERRADSLSLNLSLNLNFFVLAGFFSILLKDWRCISKIMGIQICEIFFHTLSSVVLHKFDHFAVDLQQPESGGYFVWTDNK